MTRGNTAAVRDGRLCHFSVSQIRDFERCPALWAAQKIFRMPTEQGRGAAKGGQLHTRAEDYYRYGTEFDHDAWQAALPMLPARHEQLGIELSLWGPTLFVEDTRFEGHSDLVVPPELSSKGIPEIWDWKFTSSFRYTEDPANDLQMLTYGYWASVAWPSAAEISVNLIYFLADGDDFKPRREVVPVARCQQEWRQRVVPTVQRMRALVTQRPALFSDVDKNASKATCGAYGGCSFVSDCGTEEYVARDPKAARAQKALLAAFDGALSPRPKSVKVSSASATGFEGAD